MIGYLILIGFMGAGKTSVGTRYSKQKAVPFIDTDQLIEQLEGMAVSEIFKTRGEECFRRAETYALGTLAAPACGGVISVGGGLPMREENRLLMRRIGTVVYLRVRPETVLERLQGDTTRPLLQGEDVKGRVSALLAERGPVYQEAAHLVLDVDGKDFDEIIEELDILIGES